MAEDLHTAPLNGDGPAEEVETTEELQAALKKLSDLPRADGQLVTFSKQQIGLLMQLVHVPEQMDAARTYLTLLPSADFVSVDEMWAHLNAFDEAVYWGLDLWQNVRYLQALLACNRKGSHQSSRAANIMETMSHQKFTSNVSGKGHHSNAGSNPRSPLN